MIKTIYVVQLFELRRKRLVPTTKVEARDENNARMKAERQIATKPGAVVLAITLDTDTGEVESTKLVARYGETPDDLDQMLGG